MDLKNYQNYNEKQYKIMCKAVKSNPDLMLLLEILQSLNLKQCVVCAGAVFQSILNYRHGNAIDFGIKDYDVFYFDEDDISYEAEDKIIKKVESELKKHNITLVTDIKNQARVHLWRNKKYGTNTPPYKSIMDSLKTFSNKISCIGVYKKGERLLFVAPYGVGCIFSDTIEPVYSPDSFKFFQAKAESYVKKFPYLKIVNTNQEPEVNTNREPTDE